jgi:hypothetical protein
MNQGLASISEVAGSYAWLHRRCATRWTRLHYAINIPIVILSGLAGTASLTFGGARVENADAVTAAQLSIGVLNILVAIMGGLEGFCGFEKKAEAHTRACREWETLQLGIESGMSLDAYLKEIERLIEESPLVGQSALDALSRDPRASARPGAQLGTLSDVAGIRRKQEERWAIERIFQQTLIISSE